MVRRHLPQDRAAQGRQAVRVRARPVEGVQGLIQHARTSSARPGPAEGPGRVILLNGTSSSGKTSIAEQLLLLLDPPHFHMAVDAINGMRGKAKTLALTEAELPEVLARTRAGFHRAVAGMARAGNHVVMDYVLSERWRLLDCLAVFDGIEVVFVGIRCGDAELERRERARGDREPGLAVAQQQAVHGHGEYDLECDTSAATPRECAALIAGYLATGGQPAAFGLLRARLGSPG